MPQLNTADPSRGLNPHDLSAFDPAVDQIDHDKFLKMVASPAGAARGSPLYTRLEAAYQRHRARLNGSVSIAKADQASDAPLPNGGLPYDGFPADRVGSDVSTQEMQLAIIVDTINAARAAIGAHDGGMAKARAQMRAVYAYQHDENFRKAVDDASPAERAQWSTVRNRLGQIAKSRPVTVDDARENLAWAQGKK